MDSIDIQKTYLRCAIYKSYLFYYGKIMSFEKELKITMNNA